MSGPKVVRIMTREEIIAICEGLLAQLREAIVQWSNIGKRNDLITEEELATTRQRVREIEALQRADEFAAVRNQVPQEIAYLKSDMARRLADATRSTADARTRARRLRETASQLMTKLQQADRAALPALAEQLAAMADGSIRDATQAERIIHQALVRVVAPQLDTAPTEAQRALAARLNVDTQERLLDGWLAAHSSVTETTDGEIDRAIAELALDGEEADSEFYARRQHAIAEESSPQRRRMLADTLLLELSKARAAVKERQRKLDALSEQAALLAPIRDDNARRLALEARAAVAEADTKAAERLLPAINDFVLAHRKTLAAQTRRQAVLTALAALGYEVREGMETAWVSEGRLAVKRAANPEMGVEIAGAAAERLQMRPIRFAGATAATSAGSDRDIEVMWCLDFDAMQKRLVKERCAIVVEKVTPLGEAPVKVVSDQSESERRAATLSRPRERSL